MYHTVKLDGVIFKPIDYHTVELGNNKLEVVNRYKRDNTQQKHPEVLQIITVYMLSKYQLSHQSFDYLPCHDKSCDRGDERNTARDSLATLAINKRGFFRLFL